MSGYFNRHLYGLVILGAVCSATALPGTRDPGQAVAVLHGDRFMPFYWTMVWPHAFVADDQVFCAFQNSLGQPMITAYDIEQGEWGPVHLVSERSLRPGDTHGNP